MLTQNWKTSSNCTRTGWIIIAVLLTLVLHAQSAFPQSLEQKGRFEIPLQYYQIAQLYGPGMSPSGKEGLHTRLFQKPVGRIGLVIVHPWNLGEPDGPYPFDPAVG